MSSVLSGSRDLFSSFSGLYPNLQTVPQPLQHHISMITSEIMEKTTTLLADNERSALVCMETKRISDLRTHAKEAMQKAQRLFGDIETRFQQLVRIERDPLLSFSTLFPGWVSVCRLYLIRAVVAVDGLKMCFHIIRDPDQKDACFEELEKVLQEGRKITERIERSRGIISAEHKVSTLGLELSQQLETEMRNLAEFITFFAASRITKT